MAIINNKNYPCKFYKRAPNSQDATNVPIFFMAELVSDKERAYNQKILNFVTPSTRFVIRTDSRLIYDWNDGQGVRGYVEFQGDIYQVQNIMYDLSTQSGLGAGRFSKQQAEANAIKTMALV